MSVASLFCAAVKFDQAGNIDIAHAVAVGQHERFIADKFRHALHASARIGIHAGIEQMHDPILAVAFMDG